MRDDNYEKIVKKVAISSGLDVSEVEKRVEAKRSKLAGLISLEGALQVVAAELGISFENERSKINDLLPGMRKVNVVGQILNLSPVRSFTTKKGDSGKVANMILAEDKSIVDFRVGDNTSVRAFIVQTFEPKFFHVCSECKKKVITEGNNFKCNEHGLVSPEKRALINIVLDDGTETIRSVLFHDKLTDLGLTDLENSERLMSQRRDLIGKEMIFKGNVRNNSFFNNP